jgi:HD-like signal output (HDOD) protein
MLPSGNTERQRVAAEQQPGILGHRAAGSAGGAGRSSGLVGNLGLDFCCRPFSRAPAGRACPFEPNARSPMSQAHQHDLSKLLARAQLPALPQSAIKILELSRDPDIGPAELAAPIETDPGLTGQILRFVNSSYFGFSREIANVRLAITLVGVRSIKNFALWSAVFSLLPNPKCGAFDLGALWQDSVRRGLFARMLVKLLGQKDGEEAFAAALLQDMAVPLLAKEFPSDYAVLLSQRQGGARRLSELERERFGWDHAQAAGQMAQKWNLPASLATLIAEHTQEVPLDGATEPEAQVRAAVRLSGLLPPVVDETWHEAPLMERAYETLQPAGGPTLLELLEQLDGEFTKVAPALKVKVPAKSLVASYPQPAAAAS